MFIFLVGFRPVAAACGVEESNLEKSKTKLQIIQKSGQSNHKTKEESAMKVKQLQTEIRV